MLSRMDGLYIMTNEEAIALLRTQKGWFARSNDELARLVGKAMEMGADALELQIPKGVINFSETEEEVGKIGYALCPRCRKFVAGKYCSYCGQKLAYLTIEEERERIKA